MCEYVEFVDDGTIESLGSGIYKQGDVVGKYYKWCIADGIDVMVVRVISDGV